MIDYKIFPGLAGVFLEDSYVLGISECSEQLVFHLDAVLTPEHSAYHSPRPGEHYCYANGSLVSPMSPVSYGSGGIAVTTPTLPAKRISGTSTSSRWTATPSSRRVIGVQFGSPEHNRASNSVDDFEPPRWCGRGG